MMPSSLFGRKSQAAVLIKSHFKEPHTTLLDTEVSSLQF
jgi:hypothetical protein